MLRRLSLRARLLLAVVALAAAGLAVADVATYASLRSFLVDRVDAALAAARGPIERSDDGPGPRGDDDRRPERHAGGLDRGAQGVDWYQVRAPGGGVLAGGFLRGGGSPPVVGGARRGTFTAASADGSTTYRVRAWTDPRSGEVFLAAASLHDVDATLHRLLLVELLVTLAVLTAVAGLGLWVVRLGLRPLREIEATAATIAAGDLSQRVERAEPETEVGRLGLSLNAMLGQIEAAFEERRRSERRLRQFVADASHELRTPLAAVRAYAELFGRGAAERPDDLARSMAGIGRETERMSLLVEDLLLLARLDEGRPLERSPVDLAAVVREAVDAARVVDGERPIEDAVEPATVLGDRDRLRQVLDNLFANVRSHTPPGTHVEVGLRPVDGRAELTMSDSGPGLSAEDAAQVFERFYRVDSSRARSTGGVGLGLSIVAAIAGAHGGTAAARPTPGGGATFVVSVPLSGTGPAAPDGAAGPSA